MPECPLCQSSFDTDEEVAAHMEADHTAPPGGPGFGFNLDQAAELVLPMLQEYMNHAAHSSAALKLVEIAVRNNQEIEEVLEQYETAMKVLSTPNE